MLLVLDVINQWQESLGVKVYYMDTGDDGLDEFEVYSANYNVMVVCPFGKLIIIPDEIQKEMKERSEDIIMEINEVAEGWDLDEYDVFDLVYLRIATGDSMEKCLYDWEKFYTEREAAQVEEEEKIEEEHKKLLLSTWDEAVKRQTTDRSLEILRELDLYLTPNEGLALQEAARDVFRNKLHNLGVQFSLAVSGKQWGKAIETGLQIIHDFPNSKMAEEIRGKMNILKQNIKKQS